MSASSGHLAVEGRRRIVAEVDAAVVHQLRVFAAEHDSTISDVLRNLLEDLLHETSLPLRTISVPGPPLVKSPPRLLCLGEVAGHFQRSPETVRRWVRRGEIKAVRGGGRGYRFDPAEVSRFQRQSSTGGRT